MGHATYRTRRLVSCDQGSQGFDQFAEERWGKATVVEVMNSPTIMNYEANLGDKGIEWEYVFTASGLFGLGAVFGVQFCRGFWLMLLQVSHASWHWSKDTAYHRAWMFWMAWMAVHVPKTYSKRWTMFVALRNRGSCSTLVPPPPSSFFDLQQESVNWCYATSSSEV